jgi:hypothetical protein
MVKLQVEERWFERRCDQWLALEAKKRWKVIGKAQKACNKLR